MTRAYLGRLPVDVDIEFVVECLRGAELWQQGVRGGADLRLAERWKREPALSECLKALENMLFIDLNYLASTRSGV